MHGDAVNAVADLGSRIGHGDGVQSLVDRPPRLAGIIGTEGARSRDGDKDPAGYVRIEKNGVQAHPTGAWRPMRPRPVAAESGEFLPILPAVSSAEHGGIFHAGVNGIRIGQGWLEVPDPLELPRVG